MQSLPLPTTVTQVGQRGHRTLFTIEPLYPGYGTTVGNALRRVLLSSLSGAAITSVKFAGATHEFSSLPYVKEDVVDIVLNLKQVRLKVHTDEPVKASLRVSGDRTVTAGDIETTSDVEIVNPDQPIATITDAAGKMEMEFVIERGRGYDPIENREKEKLELGAIAIDAIFTPVKTVNFTTEHVRVAQMTNFDKLMLDITTDGTISPAEALRHAAEIMVDHFTFVLSNIGLTAEASADETSKDAATETGDETPKKKIRKSSKTTKKDTED